ncbi:sensor histidine kinase [Thalassotalea ganghwensis]
MEYDISITNVSGYYSTNDEITSVNGYPAIDERTDMKNSFSTRLNRYFPFALHGVVLVILVALSLFVSYAVKGSIVPDKFFFNQAGRGLIINIAYFYLVYGLLSIKISHQRLIRLLVSVLLWLIAITLTVWLDSMRLSQYQVEVTTEHYYYFLLVNGVVKSFFAICSFCTWAVVNLVRQKLRYNQLELNALQTQLDLLKSQTNPHFLFNTLNALYSKAYTEKQHQLAESIGQLSSLMRYTLMQSDKNWVLLEDEIDHLEAYIALQELRSNRNCLINFNYGPIAAEVNIPPMLLNPLVENAFKYGLCDQQASEITINLSVTNNQLTFEVINFDLSSQIKNSATYQPSGSGLNNLRQRLALLFEQNFTLSTKSQNGLFHARLTIPCQ